MSHFICRLLIRLTTGIALLFACVAAPCAPASAAASSTYHYYVANDGLDSNPGTQKQPFETILRASRLALPGTTIHVAPGTYRGGFKTMMSGTAAQRIYYVSTAVGGARIIPPVHSDSTTAWENHGSFVDIVGFDVDGGAGHTGVKWSRGIYNAGSYALIKHNRVHHLAQDLPCTTAGGFGIFIDSLHRGDQNEVDGNTVHDIGPPSCRFAQGIYISTSGRATNNVVFRVGGSAILMWHDAQKVVVSNNTVAASMTGILIGGGDNYHTKGPNDYTSVHNNIVYDNTYGIAEKGTTGVHNSYRNNLVHQNVSSDWQLLHGLKHTGTVAVAPQFVRYARAGTPDFRLRPTSPAIGKGTNEHAAPTDIAGKVRNKDGGIDIGAYQH